MSHSESIVDFLRAQPVIALFLALGGGYLVGRIKLFGLSLGAVAGTLLVSILLGHYGLRISPGAQAVGFALFIFAVGYQAGPRFFEILKTQGLSYFALSLVVAAIGFAATAAATHLLHLPLGAAAGLFAGALTTTPALAAAQEAVRTGIVAIPAGTTAEQVVTTIGTSYAITYIVGLLGLIAAIRLMPRMLGIDLAEESRKLDLASGVERPPQLQARAYRVSDMESCRVAVGELAKQAWDGLAVVRLRRAAQWVSTQPGDRLQIGDEIFAYGDATLFHRGIARLGPEIPIPPEVDFATSFAYVVIARRDAIGKTLAELDLSRRHGLVVTEVRRDGLALPVSANLQLERGDVLGVVGQIDNSTVLGKLLGPVESTPVETDMTTFALGIAIGSAVGLLSINVAGVPIGLGAAGGLLAAGIVTGWLNGTRPTVGKFPEAARWILMEFGLLLFMCGVGLQAGGEIVEAFRQSGLSLIVAAIVVVLLPLFGGYLFGRIVFKLPPVLLLGALTGAMTSAAALSILTSEAKSPIPALGYTGAYAFANVILALAGSLAMLI